MRYDQIHRVLNMDLRSPQKAVLTVLSILAEPSTKQIQLSFSDLERLTSLSNSTVQRAIKNLEKDRLIECWRAKGRAQASLFQINLVIVEKHLTALEMAVGAKIKGVRLLRKHSTVIKTHGPTPAAAPIEEIINNNINKKTARELTYDDVFATNVGQHALQMHLGSKFFEACKKAGKILDETNLAELAKEPAGSYLPMVVNANREREQNLRIKYLRHDLEGSTCH